MAFGNLSKYYPIVMKFSRHLPLDGDTSANYFGPDLSIPLAGRAPKMGHNELDCSIDLKLQTRNFQQLYCVLRHMNFLFSYKFLALMLLYIVGIGFYETL